MHRERIFAVGAALCAALAALLLVIMATMAPPAKGAWADERTILELESAARPAPYPVRALAVQTVKHLRAAGFSVARPAVVYARRPFGAAEAYVRGPGQVVVLPRAQRALTRLAGCVRARLTCSTTPAARFAAETLVHETLHTIWTGSPELAALEDYAFDSYGEGVVEAVTVDLMPGWYARVAGRRIAGSEPSTYQGEAWIVREETARLCGGRRSWGGYCARRARADLLRAAPAEWVRVLERR